MAKTPQSSGRHDHYKETVSSTDDAGLVLAERPYRWVVLLGGFVAELLLTGTVLSAGVYLVELQDWFGVGAASVAGIATALVCGYQSSIYISGALCRRFGCRPIALAGGFLTVIFTLLASFSTQLWHVFLTLSLAGISCGIAYMPPVVVVKFYFKKQLGLANGVVFAGVGAGIVVLAPLVELFCSTYGWKGALRLHAALNANLLVCAALFRPARGELRFLERCREPNRISLEQLREQDRDRQRPVNEHQGHEIELSIAEDPEITQTRNHRAENCFWKLLRQIDTFFALSVLLKNRLFVIFSLTFLCYIWGYLTTLLFVPPRLVKDLGFPKETSSLVMLIIGVTSMMTRIVQGLVIDSRLVSVTNLYLLGGFVSGISPLLNPFVTSLNGHIVLAIVFGIGTGGSVATFVPLCREYLYVSSQNAPNAIGFLSTVSTVSLLVGTLLSGKLRDVTGSYVLPFVINGALIWMSSLVLGLVVKTPCCRRKLRPSLPDSTPVA